MPYDPNLPTLSEVMGRSAAPDTGPQRDSLWDILKSNTVSAYSNLRYGLPAAVERATGTLTPQDEQYYNAWNNYRQQQAHEIAPTGAAGFSDLSLAGGKVGLGRFAAENLAAMAPHIAGMVAGGVVGSAIGPEGTAAGLIGATIGGTPQFAGSNASRALQETGGITESQAQRSLAMAPLQSAENVAGELFMPFAGKFLGFAPEFAGNFALRAAKSAMAGSLVQATAATAQSAQERYAAGLSVTDGDAYREFVQAFGTGGVLGGAFGALTGGFRPREMTQITERPANEATNEGLASSVDSVLALPSPQTFGREPGGPEIASGPPMFTDSTGRSAPESQINPTVMANLPRTSEAAKALTELPIDQLQAVAAKIENTGGSPELAAAVQQELYSRTFPGQLEAMRKGAKNQFTSKLQADSLEEAQQKVWQQLSQNADTRPTTVRFAQRLGLLDENGDPTARYTELEAQKPEPVERSPEFEAQLQSLKDQYGQRSVEVRQLDPRNETDLDNQIVQALAGRSPEEVDARQLAKDIKPDTEGGGTLSTPQAGLLQLAEQRGLIQPVGDQKISSATSPYEFTDKGKQSLRAAPDDPADLERALKDYEASRSQPGQAYEASSAERAAFIRGASGMDIQSKPETSTTKFDNFSDAMAAAKDEIAHQSDAVEQAYRAGQDWKLPATQDEGGTTSFLDTKTAGGTDAKTGDTVTKTAAGEQVDIRGKLTDAQLQQRELSATVDKLNLPATDDTTRARLHAMINEGATREEVQRAVDTVKSGGSLFVQPERQASTYTGERIDATTRRRNLERRQAEELARQGKAEVDLTRGPSKASVRAETAEAVRRFEQKDVREKIDTASSAGDVAPIDRIRLVAMLRDNRADDVRAYLDDVAENGPRPVLEQRQDVTPRDTLSRTAAALAGTTLDRTEARVVTPPRTPAAKGVQALARTGNVEGLLRSLAKNSSDTGYRSLAQKLSDAGGWDRVTLSAEDPASAGLYGTTTLNSDGKSSIILFGKDGMTEETMLHELLHAYVQQRWASLETGAGDAIQSFQKLWGDIGSAIRETNPELLRSADPRDAWAHNFVADPDEALSWIMTNKQAQAYLKTIDETGAKIDNVKNSLWERVKQWFTDVLGIKNTPVVRSALDHLLDAGNAVIDSGKDVRTGEFNANMTRELGREGMIKQQSVAPPRTADETNTVAQELVRPLAKAVESLQPLQLKETAFKSTLGWMSVFHMGEQFDRLMPQLKVLSTIDQERHATGAKFSQLFSSAYQRYEALTRQIPEHARRINDLMRSTEFGIDPTRPWSDQTWLHDRPNAVDLKSATERANKLYREVSKERDGVVASTVYDQFRALNEMAHYAEMAISLHNIVHLDPELKGMIAKFPALDPTGAFRENLNLSSNPFEARRYWKQQLDDRATIAREFLKEYRGELPKMDGVAAAKAKARLNPLELRLRSIAQSQQFMDQAPYFHLGRFGDQFLSFRVANKDGVVEKDAVAKIAQRFADRGFDDIFISTDNTRPGMYMRFTSKDARVAAEQLVKQFSDEGLLEPDSAQLGGPRSASTIGASPAANAKWVDNLVQEIGASPIFATEGLDHAEAAEVAKQRDAVISQIREQWLDTLSDTALAKVMVQRKSVPGSATDMVRSMGHRYQMSVMALANLSAAPEITHQLTGMRGAVNEARNLDSPKHADVDKMQSILNETLLRQAQRTQLERNVFSDKLRAVSNAFYLGLSPAYVLTQMTQIPVLLIPELGKTNGYAKSFGAVAKATGPALSVMRAVLAEGRRIGNMADVVITPEVLKSAGLNESQTRFISKMIASGTIDIGSFARELGRVADGTTGAKIPTALRYASSFGLYSEILTRLIAGLSAKELHDPARALSAEDYAKGVINNAMFNYASSNTARQLGKGGFFGQVTPIMTQFMQYSAQLTEKLYREFSSAISGTPEARREGIRFLAGHAVAMTALSGTLGLPFATAIAGAVGKLKDLFDDDDEPFDAVSAWRGFMASVFGKDMGEVLSRGAPRALGFDLSSRIGEQDLLPFSGLLTDRRQWKDILQDQALRSYGAPIGMVTSVLGGMDKIGQGNLIGGMADMSPVFLKNIAKGGQLYSDGFVDSKGNKLPIDNPTGRDIMYQLLGLNPEAKAEYTEKAQAQNQRNTAISRETAVIRNNIVKALINGDQDKLRSYVQRAQEFDRNHPTTPILPSIGGALSGRIRQTETARALGTPIGVRPQDLRARELTAY